MEQKIKISCIIPTCDRPKFLEEAVRSILAQTFLPYEIIVVNNGESEIMLPDDFKNKIVMHNFISHVGASRARNFGANVAKGDYLAFLDDDDLWNKKYLENVAESIERGARCVISRLDCLENNKISAYKNAHGKLSIDNLLFFNPGVTGSNIVIAKDIFLQVGGFDSNLTTSEDKSLILEVLKNNIKVEILPENQAILRIHPEPRLSSPDKLYKGISRFTKKYFHLMNKRQLCENYLKIYRYKYEAGDKKSFLFFALFYFFVKILNIFKFKNKVNL